MRPGLESMQTMCARVAISGLLLLAGLSVTGCVTPQEAMAVAERALHKTQEIQAKQEALEQRTAALEQHAAGLEDRAKKVEELAAEMTVRELQIREILNAHSVKYKEDRDRLVGEVSSRFDHMNRQMETLRKDIIGAVQVTNGGLVKNVDTQFESLDVVTGTLLLRIEDLEKRLQTPKSAKGDGKK